MKTVVVIGAGVGGLTASLRLARAGCDVLVMEGRSESGGLAAGCQARRATIRLLGLRSRQ
jgi:phytoene dehydrogenase-like protein